MSVEVASRSEWDQPDLVKGTRVFIQSMPPPLSGRLGVIEDYDNTMHAYVVHVEGGNPRQIYRENLRIAPFDESTGEQIGFPVIVPKKTRRGPHPRVKVQGTNEPDIVPEQDRNYISAGDQLLLCIENDQFTLTEVQGIRRLTKSEPHAFALSLGIDDIDVPRWVRKAQGRGNVSKRSANFRPGETVYAQWIDGRFYPGKIKQDLRDKFLIEWLGTGISGDESMPRPVKKSLVCKRSSFAHLKSKPSFLGALAVASGAETPRAAGKRGRPRKEIVTEEEENEDARSDVPSVDDQEDEEEEEFQEYASSSSSAADLEIANGGISRSVWKAQVLPVLRLLRSVGISGFVDSQRKQAFAFPLKSEPSTTQNLEASFLDWVNDSAEQRAAPEVAAVSGFWACAIPINTDASMKKRRLEELVEAKTEDLPPLSKKPHRF